MDEKKLRSIIKKEEGTKLDFKLKLEFYGLKVGKKEFAKDICAISNSRGAGRGYIIVGVRDKTKEIVGLKKMRICLEKKLCSKLLQQGVNHQFL